MTNVRDDLLCSAINVLDMAGAGFLLIAAASVMLSVDTGHHLVRTVRIRVSRAVDLLVRAAADPARPGKPADGCVLVVLVRRVPLASP